MGARNLKWGRKGLEMSLFLFELDAAQQTKTKAMHTGWIRGRLKGEAKFLLKNLWALTCLSPTVSRS